MNYILCIKTPDSTEEAEEVYETVVQCQVRKDQLFAMPWVVGGLSVNAFDELGREVDLK